MSLSCGAVNICHVKRLRNTKHPSKHRKYTCCVLLFFFFLTLLVLVRINPLIPLSVSDLVCPLSYARLLNNSKNKTSINPDIGIIKASMLGFPLASRSSPGGTSLSVPLHFAARQISIIRTLMKKKKKNGTTTLSSSTWPLISSRNNPSQSQHSVG